MAKRSKFRRCIVLKTALKAGHTLGIGDLDFKRPGTGIAPTDYPYVVGRTLKHDSPEDHELAWTDLA
jgi:N-acetylneuraminate synthase